VQCRYPDSIGVSGGSPSSISGAGGDFTVTATPPSLSATMVDCGQHYRLQVNGPGGSFFVDCKMSAFNDSLDVMKLMPGDAVNVTLQLPPTACGQ
jgi:hypothetical protein